MQPDDIPPTLDNQSTHRDLPWGRLLHDGQTVGYVRQVGSGCLYSKDGYGWAGAQIEHDRVLPQLRLSIYRHRIFHGDIVKMAPRAGSQVYQSIVILVSGTEVCLYDLEAEKLSPITAAWPPPSSPRAQEVLGSIYDQPEYARRIDTIFAEHLVGPQINLGDCAGLIGFMHLGLVAAIVVQFLLWGHAGPVFSSLGVLAGSVVHFARKRSQDWSSLRRAYMLRQSLHIAGYLGLLWGSVQGTLILAHVGTPPHSDPWVSVFALAVLGGLIGMIATVIGGDLVAWRTGGYADDPEPESHFRDLG